MQLRRIPGAGPGLLIPANVHSYCRERKCYACTDVADLKPDLVNGHGRITHADSVSSVDSVAIHSDIREMPGLSRIAPGLA